MPGIPCGFFSPLFALYIFGNPRSESTSEARLTADPGLRRVRAARVFFYQMSSHWKTDHMTQQRERLACMFHQRLIQMMSRQEKKNSRTGKMPCQPTSDVTQQRRIASFKQVRGFLIVLTESCQDCYKHVDMTYSNPTSTSSLCSFTFKEHCGRE